MVVRGHSNATHFFFWGGDDENLMLNFEGLSLAWVWQGIYLLKRRKKTAFKKTNVFFGGNTFLGVSVDIFMDKGALLCISFFYLGGEHDVSNVSGLK